tara:strand:- start:95 stop:835 length:741 start_codon:yes stop_codon:yes gene_type:complete
MLVDVHAHLSEKIFSDKLDSVIGDAKKKGVVAIIENGMNVKNNRKVLELSSKYDIVKPALGIHPVDAVKKFDVEKEIEFISKQDVIAIGEIGLDLFHNSKLEKQKEVFEKLIAVAEKRKLPVIVHSRKAEKEVISMLESSKLKRIVMHSFTGKKGLVKKIEDNGWWLSIPPVVVRSSHFQGIVERVSMSNLLTETDSPYQSPYLDKINQPSYVSLSVKEIVKIKKLTKDEVVKLIYMNFQKVFSLK